MSTPEEPPQLTRRQLRELRNTAATPIITETPEQAEPPAAPLPRAAEPVELPEPPVADAAVEADEQTGSPALTRREIRQRERLRTASVPVITSEVLAASSVESSESDGGSAPSAADDEPAVDDWSDPATRVAEADRTAHDAQPEADEAPIDAEIVEAVPIDDQADVSDVAESAPASSPGSEHAEHADADVIELVEVPSSGDEQAESETSAVGDDRAGEQRDGSPNVTGTTPADEGDTTGASADASAGEDAAGDDRRVVAPELGANILKGQVGEAEVPASFDQLLTRGTATGALSMPNALILSQTPEGASLTAPVTATGEILITGTFALPDHYGATGTVPGRADGKEADAVLVDGELPAASSPTPIAASSAISTIKSAEEIIKPPAPERGSRLMVVLAITAGVLAVALAGVLILAITTGIF